MSTRSTTHFCYPDEKVTAIIYRHSDGYPEGAGQDLFRFLAECAKLSDTRFYDPPYLAAKYVVWLADKFNYGYDRDSKKTKRESKLDFLSVGVVADDPGDIEYRYVITCGRKPTVKCFACKGGYDGEDLRHEEVTDFAPEADTGWTAD